MIDWEDIQNSDSEEELNKLKIFLFQENLRLSAQEQKLEEEKARLVTLQDDFMKDRVRLRDELDELNRRTLAERKKLKEENLFFDKKMAILTDGFRNLEEDRKKFEADKKLFLEKAKSGDSDSSDAAKTARFLFRNVDNNALGLRKRYKDLMKVFHPDNLFGDGELVQAINKEYQRRRDLLQ